MAISYTETSYLPAGILYAKKYGATDEGLQDFGNTQAITINKEITEASVENQRTCGGGKLASRKRITGVSIEFDVTDFNARNFSFSEGGLTTSTTEGAVTGEPHTVWQNSITRLVNFPKKSVDAVITNASPTWTLTTAYGLGDFVGDTGANGRMYKATVAGTSAGTEPTFPTTTGGTVVDGTVTWTDMGLFAAVAGTDFDMHSTGFSATTSTDGGIADGLPVSVAYTSNAGETVSALQAGFPEYELVYESINTKTGDCTDLPFVFFRVQIGPSDSTQIKGDEATVIALSGEVLQDSNGDYYNGHFS